MIAAIITILIVSAVIAIIIIGNNKNNTNHDYENWKQKQSDVKQSNKITYIAPRNDSEREMTTVAWEDFTYKHNPLIGEDIFLATESDDTHITLPKYRYETIKQKISENDRKIKLLNECAANNNEGIKLEKEGNIEAAIKKYESNIFDGRYQARHSFDRLIIPYRKEKDYNNEIRVIKRAIEVFPGETKYTERLQKINTLLL